MVVATDLWKDTSKLGDLESALTGGCFWCPEFYLVGHAVTIHERMGRRLHGSDSDANRIDDVAL